MTQVMVKTEKFIFAALVAIFAAAVVGCSATAPVQNGKTTPAAAPPHAEKEKLTPVAPQAQTEKARRAGAQAPLRVSAVGDIMLGGTAGPELRMLGYDYPFVHVQQFFKDSHIVFGNLEGPLTTGGQAEPDKQFVFRSPPAKVVPALKAAGFNLFSLANNHTLDYGPEGLRHTIAALDEAGIAYAGAGENVAQARRPAIITAEGRKVAVLAYSMTLPENFYAGRAKPGTAFGHENHVRTDVAQARKQADLVLVSFHWGQEGKTELREYQTRLGRAAIDAGAAAVLGHHPHILQGIERYKDGVILYSLGNFVFGSYSKTAKTSVVAQLSFEGTRLSGVQLIPVNVYNPEVNFQPLPLAGANADAVVEHLRQLSRPFGTAIENEAGIGVLRL